MIVDFHKDRSAASFSLFDAETGECLDSERWFYADDEAGFYHRHLKDENKNMYAWDSRTRKRLERNRRDAVPEEFIQIAWDRVDRRIELRPKKIEAA